MYELAAAEGYGRLHHAAVAKRRERWPGTPLATEPEDEA